MSGLIGAAVVVVEVVEDVEDVDRRVGNCSIVVDTFRGS